MKSILGILCFRRFLHCGGFQLLVVTHEQGGEFNLEIGSQYL